MQPMGTVPRRPAAQPVDEYTDSMPSDSSPSNTNTPRLLALDTATDRLAVAVVHGDRTVSANEEGGARASARLLPRLLLPANP